MPTTISKSDAIARTRRDHPARILPTNATHFASINASKDVWWYDIPVKKVTGGQVPVLHLLAHDHRSNELHHLALPTKDLREHIGALVIRRDRDTISLELSAGRSNFMQDVRPGSGRVHFAEFLHR